jgi:hypothetical protein
MSIMLCKCFVMLFIFLINFSAYRDFNVELIEAAKNGQKDRVLLLITWELKAASTFYVNY